MIKIPPYLKQGDTVGLVCPAGYMALEKVQACVQALQHAGYKVLVGKTVGSDSLNYFSGSDDERLEDFQSLLDNNEVAAVLCARGGYGTSRILDRIRFKQYKRKPKWIIGYSDITALHAHLYSKYGIASLHAPMAAAFNDGDNEYLDSVLKAVTGEKYNYTCEPHEFNRTGKVKGDLIGGNLTLLAHLAGSVSEYKTKGRILFMEDIGEYIYNIDRMLVQIKRSGMLKNLAGAVIGKFTDTKDTERPFGKSVYEVIRDIFEEYDYPICFNFPVSHDKENYALKVGVEHILKVGKSRVHLQEGS
jgi:muramoyltetrapeptide carboxypeptidase